MSSMKDNPAIARTDKLVPFPPGSPRPHEFREWGKGLECELGRSVMRKRDPASPWGAWSMAKGMDTERKGGSVRHGQARGVLRVID